LNVFDNRESKGGQASVTSATSVIVRKFEIKPYSRKTWEFKDGKSTFHDDET
jgi:hypothetical protein